ncbi:sulfur carrier protein ThiS [Buchnera aphidicola (Neophyllaphis varicolor)]|uniref:sulfur carrier protein ThiS n=1 Tax=Buchnera aphidicola TaxID=9 RepID=UPI0031B8A464
MIKIWVNDSQIKLNIPYSISNLIDTLKLDINGIAFAVNSTVISDSNWINNFLKDGDKIVVFHAINGG